MEGNSREITKQDKYYSLQQTSPIYHSIKPQNFPERQSLDPPQTVSQEPEISHPDNIDLECLECAVEQDIETKSLYEEELIEQENSRLKRKHFQDSSKLKRQVNTSKVMHTLIPKQTD